jgi:monofunctional biosynthetic peptidoglycan transglycosylase
MERSRSPSRPVPLDHMTPALKRMVVLAEDWRFQAHHGIDFDAIREAAGVSADAGLPRTIVAVWNQRGGMRGASTITQQLAKNLYLTSSRSFLRKLKEAVIAVRLELALDKDRILELYLNVAEWGPDIWGVDEASAVYFHTNPAQLTPWQAATLAATLPHPRTSNMLFRPARMAARRDLILARYHGADVVIPPAESMPEIQIDPPPVRIPLALDSLMADSIVISDTGSSR